MFKVSISSFGFPFVAHLVLFLIAFPIRSRLSFLIYICMYVSLFEWGYVNQREEGIRITSSLLNFFMMKGRGGRGRDCIFFFFAFFSE